MDVTPQELRGSEIKDAWRGYDRDEVDDLLERAAVTIEHMMLQLQDVQAHPPAVGAAPAPVPLPSSRDDAEMLQRTLLLAQRAADDAVNEANARARQIVEEAEAKAQALVGDAEATARRIAEGERRRLEAEIQELSARRELLRSDADALDAYASAYREKLRETLEGDLATLTSGGAVAAPAPRPEVHEVEIPAASAPVVAEPAPEPAPAPFDAPFDAPPAAAPAAASAAAPVASSPEPAPSWDPGPATTAIATEPEPARDWPPSPSAQATAAPVSDAPAQSSWLGDDAWAAEPALESPAPWERDTAHHEPFSSDVPMEANPVDTDSLSDDQFFASLREAVRDDAPLGPNDDPDADFFEPDADDRRRGFRRRR
jgi:DivIVA domain-containing protein